MHLSLSLPIMFSPVSLVSILYFLYYDVKVALITSLYLLLYAQ